MVEDTPTRPEFVFSTILWNSLGALEAALAFVAAYATARWVAALRGRSASPARRDP